MRTLFGSLSAALLLGHSVHVYGLSTFIQLTATNIQTDYSFLTIKTQDCEGDAKRFTVIVAPRDGVSPANLSGSLSVRDGTNIIASCAVLRGKLPRKSKDVDQRGHDQAVVFEFVVARKYLATSRFSVIDQPPDIPSFTAYWFYLQDFGDAK